MTSHRPTKAEQEQRLTQIHTLLVSNVARGTICRFVSEKTTWNLTDRSIDRYIAVATNDVTTDHASPRPA